MRNETTNYGVTKRDLYFRAFDKAMQHAEHHEGGAAFEKRLSLLDQYGSAAGFSATEIESRKQTLLYNLTHGVRE